MPAMKRLVLSIWIVFLGFSAALPIAFTANLVVNAPTVLASNVVEPDGGAGNAPTPQPSPTPAATTCSQDGNGACNLNLLTPQQCVKISLPIVGNNTCIDNSPANGGAIVVYLRLILQLMSSAVGIVIVLMLIIAGIQYITSAGDPSNTKAAKTRITNAITALVLFMFMVAILQFLVPGGIL